MGAGVKSGGGKAWGGGAGVLAQAFAGQQLALDHDFGVGDGLGLDGHAVHQFHGRAAQPSWKNRRACALSARVLVGAGVKSGGGKAWGGGAGGGGLRAGRRPGS